MGEELAEKPGQFQFRLEWGRKLWHGFVNALTPAKCLVCATDVQDSASVCIACWQKLKLLDEPVCNVMGTPFVYDQGEGALSAEALSFPPPWDRARAAVVFDEHSKEIIHAFKYGDRAEAGLFMARLMARAGRSLIGEADMIVPVPLHWTRLWKRRFNQAGFLAQRIAKAANKPYKPQLLKRVRATPPQVGLDAEARRKNMRKAFHVVGAEKLAGKTVLLIDDVRTTGATTRTCVETLKEAGAARVHVLTFGLVIAPFRPHIEGRNG